MRAEGIAPALVLCSAAMRARETLDGIAPALGDGPEVAFEDDLYGASAEELLERLRRIPDTVPSAMLIGHNPAMQDLALELSGAGKQLDRLARKFPTAALATLSFHGEWAALGPASAELIAFVRPKDL